MIETATTRRHRDAYRNAHRERAAAFGRLAWRIAHPFAGPRN